MKAGGNEFHCHQITSHQWYAYNNQLPAAPPVTPIKVPDEITERAPVSTGSWDAPPGWVFSATPYRPREILDIYTPGQC